jgi:hypothetical protein
MPFGKFYPAKMEIITTSSGEIVETNSSDGYSGLLWGMVYTSNNNVIKNAEEYFYELDNNGYKYWDMIREFIATYCVNHIEPYCGSNGSYQYGFGGDECDGLIDFWTEKPIPEIPDMSFEIEGKRYVIKWHYSSGDPRDDTSVSSDD